MAKAHTFPDYTRAERRADGALHVLGVALSVAACVLLLLRVAPSGDARLMAAAGIYGAGLVATFGASAAYNLAVAPAWREALRCCDHAAIYLMIAGTYTPFALVGIGGRLGHGLLALVWLIAVAGVSLKLCRPRRLERASIVLYLALGWCGLPALGVLIAALPPSALWLLGAGGLLYTAGVAVHLRDRLPYHNAIWHGLVLLAAGCHFIAVLQTLAP